MDNYAAILSRWQESGFASYFPTRADWRNDFVKALKKDDRWKKAMRTGVRGRPSVKHRDAIDCAIVSARGDPLRLLYNCEVPIERLLEEIECQMYIHDQYRLGEQILRSKSYRNDVIAALNEALRYLAQAEVFVFQRLNSPALKEEIRRREITPPHGCDSSIKWIRFVIWVLQNAGEGKLGGPKKRDAIDYLNYRLLKIADDESSQIVPSLKKVLREPVRAITKAAFRASDLKRDQLARDWAGMLLRLPKKHPVTDTRSMTLKDAKALPPEEMTAGIKIKGCRTPPFGGSWIYDEIRDELRLFEAPTAQSRGHRPLSEKIRSN